MKLVSIHRDLLKRYIAADEEFLHKHGRPCVLIIRMRYCGKERDFAVPLRSNIPQNTPKEQYFSLPPRSTTQPGKRHGIHFLKMFPVTKQYLLKYRIDGNEAAERLAKIIDKNERRIVDQCQKYLNDYEKGVRQPYATNIDTLLEILEQQN